MAISAALVKELRERTGSGMMECKKSLVETNGDVDAAIELMRKSGLAKADKKAGRVAAEGLVALKFVENGSRGVMVEINSETDFVARDETFTGFTQSVLQRIIDLRPANVEELLAIPYEEGASDSVDEARQRLVAKIGENITIRRFIDFATSDGVIGGYSHGVRIGVLVELEGGGDAQLAKDIAMHVAASKPECVSEDDVPAGLLDKEKDIYRAQAAESGKPDDIIDKMVAGRVKKYLKEITLLGQPFVKNPDMTVEQLIKKAGVKVRRFSRFEVGEGIEKKTDNFAEEVMAQARGA